MVVAVINIGLTFEGMVFNKLSQQLMTLYSDFEVKSNISEIIGAINFALRLALTLLILLLSIYAVANYDDKPKFLKIITPKWLLPIITFWIFSLVYIFILQDQKLVVIGLSNSLFTLVSSIVFISLAVYGFRTSLKKYKAYNYNLFRYLLGFFIINISHQIVILANNASFSCLSKISPLSI